MSRVTDQIQLPRVMTVQEIEAACREYDPPTFDRYYNDSPALSLEATFFPLGFPMRVRTNSAEVLRQCGMKWGAFTQEFDTEPLETHIHVHEIESRECPPAPVFRVMENMLLITADADNVCAAHFPRGKTQMVVSSAALAHPGYFSQTFLEAAPACQIRARFASPIHAACVAIDGRGVLLCGDSGAGKTSLAYACACAGWQYISDDSSYLLHHESGRQVIGNCYQVRFRPSAVELFPEIYGAQIAPRMFGKPSIEVPTSISPAIDARTSAEVDFIVFLNRRDPNAAELVPYRRDVARCYMRQHVFGTSQSRLPQYAAFERLLKAEVLELRYQSLDWAITRLERLVREGI